MATEILTSSADDGGRVIKNGKVEKFFCVGYCGALKIDRRYIPPVLHWVALEIIRKHENFNNTTVYLTATDIEFHSPLHEAVKINQYSFNTVHRLSRLKNCGLDNYMGFITSKTEEIIACKLHVLKFDSVDRKTEFLNSLKNKVLGFQSSANLFQDDIQQPSRNLLPSKPAHRRGVSYGAIMLSPGSVDAVFRDSVYYIGKVTISQPQAPPKFIDNVLVQLQKIHSASLDSTKNWERRKSLNVTNDTVTKSELEAITRGRSASCNSDNCDNHKEVFFEHLNDKKEFQSVRGYEDTSVTLSNIQQEVQSRLVTLSISKTSLMLFSVGSKHLLLEKKIKHISYCTKGEARIDHFGFICCELGNHVCYIFQGESENKVDAIMKSMKLAFNEALEASAHLTLCESCPLQYFHKLCSRLETAATITERDGILQETIHFLSDDETLDVMNSVNQAGAKTEQERISVTVEILRNFFDDKQLTHKHSKTQAPGPINHVTIDRSRSSTIFEKAKKSLTNSFQSLTAKKPANGKTGNPSLERLRNSESFTKPRSRSYESPSSSPTTPDFSARRPEFNLDAEKQSRKSSLDDEESREKNSMDIVGDVKEFEVHKEKLIRRGSWRQAIYDSVTAPARKGSCTSMTTIASECEELKEPFDAHQRARGRWESAIMNQILLIRMEKENKKLAANISATELRRQKLSYQDLCSYSAGAATMWDELLSRRNNERIDDRILLEAVGGGVPRMRRGEIWQLLIKQHNMRSPKHPDKQFLEQSSYKSLICSNNTHQHAILIDLGRTFPTHAHFIPRFGSGQLCLFNVLKAYAALDQEVGYCQGLSFVAGLLLMHMSEEETYKSFCHLMFDLQMRNQYKPDMNAVQLQLYQLSRLLHDYHPSIYEHFNTHDVTPTLYAAPWFLTLFASQYPIGFVSRVMDLILLQGMEVIFKVALVLIGNHTSDILACDSFENIVEYMKSSLPEKVVTVANETDNICTRVLNMDIKHQLNLYEVEYQLLKEEMIDIRQNKERLEKQMIAHKVLENEIKMLRKELQNAKCAIDNLKQSLNDTNDEKFELKKQLSAATKERDELKETLISIQSSTKNLKTGNSDEKSSELVFRNADFPCTTQQMKKTNIMQKTIIQLNGDPLVDL